MLDKTSEKIESPISDAYFGESSAKTDNSVSTTQSAGVFDESDMGSENAGSQPVATASIPQETEQEYNESDSAAPVTERTLSGFPNDVATDSVTASMSSDGFPNDVATDSVTASMSSDGFPNDVATSSVSQPTSWQTSTVESSTPATSMTTATNSDTTCGETSSVADAFFVNKDKPQVTILLPSVADAFFDKDKPRQSWQSAPTVPTSTLPTSCAPMITPAPEPPLLLQDVQSDADLNLLRAKYRERYIELEEMLEYAAATSKLDPLSLSLEVKKLKKVFFYESPAHLTVEILCEAEADMEELYATLSQLIYPVTVRTLRATSELYPIKHGWWSSWLLGSNSAGLNFFRQIFWVTTILVAILILKEYINFYVGDQATTTAAGSVKAAVASVPKTALELLNRLLLVATPFLYGAIGSLVYIYKTLSDLYVCRTLDPNKLANDWMRLFMGGLMGGLTVALFYQQYYFQGNAAVDGSDVNKISAAAVAFLTGYSVEFFYRILDRIINTVLPKSADDSSTSQVAISPRQQQMDMLLKRLKDAKSDEDKAVIRGMLGKL
jgi:hypothetical protein